MSSAIPGISFAYPQASPASSVTRGTDVGGAGRGDSLGGAPGFGDVLKNTLAHVNQLEGGAHQQVGNLLAGGGGDVSSVMIAVEKADVAFQLMMQVRNKIVTAYQDIEKMQF